ncbi:hypothetical protein EVAR_48407_1 [Eumeta japonica]|uniref:Uncharacterized protein n=1 Tax=Eumeta variegata TaxID=151549 RepID=A0A4C1XP50_EUMVA|nr:hypothetical protein EVAR_48407_1 [Eumeta japonica]
MSNVMTARVGGRVHNMADNFPETATPRATRRPPCILNGSASAPTAVRRSAFVCSGVTAPNTYSLTMKAGSYVILKNCDISKAMRRARRARPRRRRAAVVPSTTHVCTALLNSRRFSIIPLRRHPAGPRTK